MNALVPSANVVAEEARKAIDKTLSQLDDDQDSIANASRNTVEHLQRQILRAKGQFDGAVTIAKLEQQILRVKKQTAQKIADISTQAIQQKTARNACAFINRLPIELLSKILLSYKNAAPGRSLDWLNITTVCSHWRKVAHEEASLWTDIDLNRDSRLTDLMLHRAKSLPVEVICTTSRCDLEKFGHIVSQRNCRSIVLSDNDDFFAGWENFWYAQAAGRIASSNTLGRLIVRIQGGQLPNKTLDTLQEMRSLGYLDITAGFQAWNRFPVVPSLVLLHLERYPGTPSPTFSLQDMVQALAEMPALEVLKLRSMIPTNCEPTLQRLDLSSRLKIFIIHDPVTSLTAFLASIRVPGRVMSELSLTDATITVGKSQAMLEALVTARSEGDETYSMDHVALRPQSVSLGYMITGQVWSYGPIIQLKISPACDRFSYEAVVKAVVRFFSDDATIFEMSNPEFNAEPDFWSSVLKNMPALNRVVVSSQCNPRNLVKALLSCSTPHDGDVIQPASNSDDEDIGSLRCIWFQSIDFGAGSKGRRDSLWDDLAEFFEINLNRRRYRLVIRSCNDFSVETYQCLRVLADVEWED